MNFGIILSIVFLSILGVTLSTTNDALSNLLLNNAFIQITLFILVACIPFLRTGRMSYVDIAWPFGVALIGLQILLFGDGDFIRNAVVGGVYLFIGLRMGIAAIIMGKTTGVIFKTEFPRYTYRKMIFEKTETKHQKLHILAEMLVQGFANMSVLALPGFILATNSAESISTWEITGLCLWAAAYMFESIADTQKLMFISKNARGVCNVGLWKFSRHPNYFSEWLVWTGLVVASIPSWLALSSGESMLVWVTQGGGIIGASVMMYITLVYLTGAIPAEYYSVRKRAGYSDYQKQTNMFFPWFPKK